MKCSGHLRRGNKTLTKDRKFYRVVKPPGANNGRRILVRGSEGQAGRLCAGRRASPVHASGDARRGMMRQGQGLAFGDRRAGDHARTWRYSEDSSVVSDKWDS
jgi:hypothetical protein